MDDLYLYYACEMIYNTLSCETPPFPDALFHFLWEGWVLPNYCTVQYGILVRRSTHCDRAGLFTEFKTCLSCCVSA